MEGGDEEGGMRGEITALFFFPGEDPGESTK